jgi:hypothetical protein
MATHCDHFESHFKPSKASVSILREEDDVVGLVSFYAQN